MDYVERWLQKHAVYSPTRLKKAPVQELFAKYKLVPLSHRGMLSYVYTCKDTSWVVKEGKWNLDLHILGDIKLKVPVEVGEKVFRDRFLPRQAEISRQYKLYLKLVTYLGVFTPETYYHPQLPKIQKKQHALRNHLVRYLDDLQAVFNVKHKDILIDILESPLKWKNFLPKEYMVVGEGLHKENKKRTTFFIFQEFVSGDSLHDVSHDALLHHAQYRRELIMLIYLMMLFYNREGLVVDTRPRSPAAQIHEWIMKTDNIFVSNSGLTLVDTRWCWQVEDDLFRRGLLIPDVTVWRLHWWLNKLLTIEHKEQGSAQVSAHREFSPDRKMYETLNVLGLSQEE